MPGLQFNERQGATVAAAITLLSAALIMAAALGAILALSYFLSVFSGVFMPLAIAAILALVIKPYYEWLLRGAGRKGIALVAVFVSLVVPFALFAWFFGSLVVGQLSGLLDRLPGWIESTATWVRQKLPAMEQFWREHELGRRLSVALQARWSEILNGLTAIGGQALAAGAGLFRAVTGCLGWVVFPIYFGFFLMAKPLKVESIESQLPFLKPETRSDLIYLVREFLGIMVSFFRGQVIVAFCQGVLFAIGFAIAGLQYGLAIGLLMGFLNLIPYLGSLLGLLLALPLAFFQQGGGWGPLIGVGAAFTVVQMIEGYLLTPRIMGRRTGLHPVTIMVAMFFWGTAMGGISGMILAIPLTAFLVVFWRLLKEKYIKAVV
ncbi:MAG: AI-2E family transporter [bacterium]